MRRQKVFTTLRLQHALSARYSAPNEAVMTRLTPEQETLMYLRFILGAALAVIVSAQSTVQLQPVKGSVQLQTVADPNDPSGKNQNRSVSVVLKLYDLEFGGRVLFEERQTVQVDEAGMFVAHIGANTQGGIPARITDEHSTMWAEYSLVSGGVRASNVTGRQEMTHRRGIGTNVLVNVPTSTTLCYSCGGSWPYFQGSWNVVYSSTNVTERGSSCSGSPTTRGDSRPYLCARD